MELEPKLKIVLLFMCKKFKQSVLCEGIYIYRIVL